MYRKSCKRDQTMNEGGTTSQTKNYLLQARHVAHSVILPRGLLKKGVGLCHGISGNGCIFMSIHDSLSKIKDIDISDEEDSKYWHQCAYSYANFGKYLISCTITCTLFSTSTNLNILM